MTKPEQVLVECWSGPEKIDRELAPLVRAWNATEWLITMECCSGHGREPLLLTVLVRLDHLTRFVATVRQLDAFMNEIDADVDLEVQHQRCIVGSVWTKRWGAFAITVHAKDGGPSPLQIERFVHCAVKMTVYEPLNLDELITLPIFLRHAIAIREAYSVMQSERATSRSRTTNAKRKRTNRTAG